MNPVWLTLAFALLLLAAAVGMWLSAGNRQRRQLQQQHLRQHLEEQHAEPGSPDPASGTPPAVHSRPLDTWLVRAGFTPGWRVPALAGITLVVVVALASWRMHNLIGGAIAAVVCLALALFWYGMRAQRLRTRLVAALPDFLENIVRLITIGQSLPMAFQHAAGQTAGPLRQVLDRALRRMRAGVDLEDALHTAGHGYRVKELELLESVLRMSSRYGGRTDQILQRMSDFMRDLEQAQQDLRSITSETRMASWVLGLLPVVSCVIMMMLNPSFFTPMFHEPLGHRLLLVSLGLEAAGAFLLYRLAKSL